MVKNIQKKAVTTAASDQYFATKQSMPKGFNAESAPKPKPAPAPAQTKPQGTLPKGFTAKPAPAPQPAKAKGTLPKGF